MEDENCCLGGRSCTRFSDCEDGGRLGGFELLLGAADALILRYFLTVGVSGCVKLSTRLGRSCLYASNIFFAIFLTSALASVAVRRIVPSISRARGSLSRSGGLKPLRQASVASAAAKRRDTDLSLVDSAR